MIDIYWRKPNPGIRFGEEPMVLDPVIVPLEIGITDFQKMGMPYFELDAMCRGFDPFRRGGIRGGAAWFNIFLIPCELHIEFVKSAKML